VPERRRADVPGEIVAELRSVCLALPEAYEEAAWVGTRWMIRKKNFAHVLVVDGGWPPAYARVVGSEARMVVLTFRSSGPELEALLNAPRPFFQPGWWPDIVGLVLDDDIDWTQVELVDRPSG
jgi:hypothetical protein